ncbi:restriction endonuclease subunit S [Pectobacterium brasiliense]|uniref:restriction endonuclease subunit S n=1 Tax=Pectobacterium brasiliense TaxID=180957 RepID=UPI00057E3DC2|nr:restriction endonuclease subunit S [Pectobacterium brasiliense]KHS69946.1 restriction endonuclease subunit S [Pectobacterium brasiliense]KHT06471.1 restriction endonuclease subunit S [Pectobacterium brasiliense]KHT11851.1 restriction endonuclease subunit S [Pectobacterium brasiliense]
MPKTLVNLEKIADVRSGFTFREAIQPSPAGDVHILQIKDLTQGSRIEPDDLPTVVWEQNSPPPLLEPGEIIVAARGNRNIAVVYHGKAPVVATNQFLIINIKTKAVLPEYLCWIINHPKIQQMFHRSGTNIQLVTKAALLKVELPMPPIETQRNIIGLQQVWEQEDQLISQLQTNRQKLQLGILQNLFKD